MTIAQNLPLSGSGITPAALRALASAGLTALNVASVAETLGLALYSYDPASLGVDTGAEPGVRKPTDVNVSSPGRWLLRDWPDIASAGTHGELLLPIVINAAGPTALLLRNGWEVINVTEVGGVRTAWLRRIIVVSSE